MVVEMVLAQPLSLLAAAVEVVKLVEEVPVQVRLELALPEFHRVLVAHQLFMVLVVAVVVQAVFLEAWAAVVVVVTVLGQGLLLQMQLVVAAAVVVVVDRQTLHPMA